MPYELTPRDCAVIDHFSEIFFALAKLEYSFDLPYCKKYEAAGYDEFVEKFKSKIIDMTRKVNDIQKFIKRGNSYAKDKEDLFELIKQRNKEKKYKLSDGDTFTLERLYYLHALLKSLLDCYISIPIYSEHLKSGIEIVIADYSEDINAMRSEIATIKKSIKDGKYPGDSKLSEENINVVEYIEEMILRICSLIDYFRFIPYGQVHKKTGIIDIMRDFEDKMREFIEDVKKFIEDGKCSDLPEQ